MRHTAQDACEADLQEQRPKPRVRVKAPTYRLAHGVPNDARPGWLIGGRRVYVLNGAGLKMPILFLTELLKR